MNPSKKAKTPGAYSPKPAEIDPEFSSLIPPLSKDELAQLEDSLRVEKRCRDPLVLWKGHNILLDGHNRLRLCDKHKIPFQAIEPEFPDREAARNFIMHNNSADET